MPLWNLEEIDKWHRVVSSVPSGGTPDAVGAGREPTQPGGRGVGSAVRESFLQEVASKLT